MRIKKVLGTWHQKINTIPSKYLVALGVLIFVSSIYVVLFRQQTIEYSYAGQTCNQRLVVLPALFKASGSDDYRMTASGGLNLWGYPIVSTTLCITPNNTPSNDAKPVSISLFGSWIARISYKVRVPKAPVASVEVLKSPIAATQPLVMKLSEPDDTFLYSIHSKDGKATCKTKDSALSCDIPALKLSQGSEYVLSLERNFKEVNVETIASMSVKTLSPVSIIASSVASGATIYDKPTIITLDTDKSLSLATFDLVKIDGDTRTPIPVETVIDDKKVTIELSSELARSSQFELADKTFEATDGSTLLNPYVLGFNTSGGPKVVGVNAATTGVTLGSTISVSFDQNLLGSQDISKIVSVTGGASVVGRQANKLLISTAGVPLCGTFTVMITKDLQSNYGISGNSAWKYTGRTVCYTIKTIGYSVGGRAINAYYFGSGTTTILYTGAIHGNEYSAKYLMDAWISEIDRNIQNLPSGRQIVVVPLVNPDGYVTKVRNNAHNVDLNRNFDVSDWKTDVTTPSNAPLPGGGGPAPMSEPEVQILASLTSVLQPRLTMSYHSSASYAIGNQAGDSASLAATYASMTGYANQTGNSSNAFSYEISGTYDDWIAEKLGLPSVLIELSSSTNSEFSRNVKALWAMARA